MTLRYWTKKIFFLVHALPIRLFVEIAVSARESMKCRSVTRISTDADGDWIRKEKGFSVVSPTYPGRNLSKHSIIKHISWTWFRHYSENVSGKILIDIGAGGGEHAILLSGMVGVQGRVIAVEANPRTFRCLLKTIKINNLENVTAINAAIFDYNGKVKIQDSNEHSINRVNTGTGVVVKCMTIDQLLDAEAIKEVDVIKLNIEGAELEASNGAKQAVRRVKHWVVSCHDFIAERSDGDATMATYDAVVNFYLSHGCYVYSPDENVPWYSLKYYVHANREK